VIQKWEDAHEEVRSDHSRGFCPAVRFAQAVFALEPGAAVSDFELMVMDGRQ
jgi:hypothetical protein